MEGASIAEEIGNGSRQAEDQLVAQYDGTLMTIRSPGGQIPDSRVLSQAQVAGVSGRM
jgi:hypothetical protein